jgi:hypothetical protein
VISFRWAAPPPLVEHLFRQYLVLAEKTDQDRIFRLIAWSSDRPDYRRVRH